MEATDLLQPVKGLDPSNPIYLGRREWLRSTPTMKRPVEEILGTQYSQVVAAANWIASIKEGRIGR